MGRVPHKVEVQVEFLLLGAGDVADVLDGEVQVKEVNREGGIMHRPLEPPEAVQVLLEALPVMALQGAGAMRANPNAAEVVYPMDEAAGGNFGEAVAVPWQECMRLMQT